MKFAHQLQTALSHADYPESWIQAAISYRQLKKCIKNVQTELVELGLDRDKLCSLFRSPGDSGQENGPLYYIFRGTPKHSEPSLIFEFDPNGGIPVSAYLAPKTRLMLETLISQQSSSATPEYVHDPNRPSQYSSKDHSLPLGTQLPYREGSPVVGHVEIPLSADSRFFRLLSMEISSLGTLQEEQETVLKGRIVHLGQSIATITVPSKNSSKTDLFIWREIFRLYIDSEIFFSVTGNHRGILNPTLAHQRLQEFGRRLAEVHIRESFKRKASYEALDNFLGINFDLLRNLKFQELNVMAMTKILKKFDKRTSLSARHKFPHFVASDSFSSPLLAKSICFQVSNELLSSIPQLNDYLCPVCFNIAFKPIRLKCNHTFCIRCMVTMQKANANQCPLCRGAVVMEADSANMDIDLMKFLKTYFPAEVKMKQKQNEHDAGVDKYGEAYDKKCELM